MVVDMNLTETSIVEPNLANTISIPAEGTLSKIVLNSERARVVIFGFDTNQELTEHTSAYPAIIHLIRGRANISLEGTNHTAEPGFWVYMPARMVHAIHALEPTVMTLTMLR
jgi:quercetin dioxygenase-like cupin family protein